MVGYVAEHRGGGVAKKRLLIDPANQLVARLAEPG